MRSYGVRTQSNLRFSCFFCQHAVLPINHNSWPVVCYPYASHFLINTSPILTFECSAYNIIVLFLLHADYASKTGIEAWLTRLLAISKVNVKGSTHSLSTPSFLLANKPISCFIHCFHDKCLYFYTFHPYVNIFIKYKFPNKLILLNMRF